MTSSASTAAPASSATGDGADSGSQRGIRSRIKSGTGHLFHRSGSRNAAAAGGTSATGAGNSGGGSTEMAHPMDVVPEWADDDTGYDDVAPSTAAGARSSSSNASAAAGRSSVGGDRLDRPDPDSSSKFHQYVDERWKAHKAEKSMDAQRSEMDRAMGHETEKADHMHVNAAGRNAPGAVGDFVRAALTPSSHAASAAGGSDSALHGSTNGHPSHWSPFQHAGGHAEQGARSRVGSGTAYGAIPGDDAAPAPPSSASAAAGAAGWRSSDSGLGRGGPFVRESGHEQSYPPGVQDDSDWRSDDADAATSVPISHIGGPAVGAATSSSATHKRTISDRFLHRKQPTQQQTAGEQATQQPAAGAAPMPGSKDKSKGEEGLSSQEAEAAAQRPGMSEKERSAFYQVALKEVLREKAEAGACACVSPSSIGGDSEVDGADAARDCNVV